MGTRGASPTTWVAAIGVVAGTGSKEEEEEEEDGREGSRFEMRKQGRIME